VVIGLIGNFIEEIANYTALIFTETVTYKEGGV